MFQRQRYELERDAKDSALWSVVELPYPTAKPVTFYLAAPGLRRAAASPPGRPVGSFVEASLRLPCSARISRSRALD